MAQVVEEAVAEAGDRFESALGRSAWQAVSQAESEQAARERDRAGRRVLSLSLFVRCLHA